MFDVWYHWIVYCDVYLKFGDGDGEVDVSSHLKIYFGLGWRIFSEFRGGDFLWFWGEEKNKANTTLKKHLTSSWAALIRYRDK